MPYWRSLNNFLTAKNHSLADIQIKFKLSHSWKTTSCL